MDSYGGGALAIEYFTREWSLQLHLHALREDEMIEEARGGGRLVESEFFQHSKPNAFARRSNGWFRRVVEAEFYEFKQRASFEEGC